MQSLLLERARHLCDIAGGDLERLLLERLQSLLESFAVGNGARLQLVDARAQSVDCRPQLIVSGVRGLRGDLLDLRRQLIEPRAESYDRRRIIVVGLWVVGGPSGELGQCPAHLADELLAGHAAGEVGDALLEPGQVVEPRHEGRKLGVRCLRLAGDRVELVRETRRGGCLGSVDPLGELCDLGAKLIDTCVLRRACGELLDARPHLVESLGRRRTLGQLVEPAAQLIERGEPRVEHVRSDGAGDALLERFEPGDGGVDALPQLGDGPLQAFRRFRATVRWCRTLLERNDRCPKLGREPPKILLPGRRRCSALDDAHAAFEIGEGGTQLARDLSCRRDDDGAAVPGVLLHGLRGPQLLQVRPLLGQGARQIET